jgi:hypothetical protein
VCDFFLAFTDNNDTHPPMTEPGFFKWGGKLLTNTWYYVLCRHVLYREINLKYMY